MTALQTILPPPLGVRGVNGLVPDLATVVRDAWEAGKAIDLGGAVYGRAVRDGKDVVLNRPSTYYRFLAGLVNTTGAHLVVEIGTNCGGSALAMCSGFDAPGEVITIDLTDDSDAYLAKHHRIAKIRGDANAIEVIEQVVRKVDRREVGILYIDAAHSCLPTLLNYSIYGALLNPRFIVIDDIMLYPTMQRMWRLITQTVGAGRALDAAEIVPAIRPQTPAPGFGLVAWRAATTSTGS
jgi:predicted O-methyltransferase YrrM